jgi:hypothetical protein
VVGGYVDDAEPDLRHGPPELTEGKPGSQFLRADVSARSGSHERPTKPLAGRFSFVLWRPGV